MLAMTDDRNEISKSALASIEAAIRKAGLLTQASPIDFKTPRVWHLLTIDPARPRIITEWLQRAKLWVYWPNFTVQLRCRGGMRRSKQVSVIHGYLPLAVHAERQDTWQVISTTPGIRGYMRDECGHPAVVRECEIEEIRRMEADLNMAPQQAAYAAFPMGTKIKFTSARLLAWDCAEVIEVADDGRIRVKVMLFGRHVPMWVMANEIEAI